MYSNRAAAHVLKRATRGAREIRRGIVTDADVEQARKYCLNQLKHGDYEAYLTRQFVPRSARDAYDALRTLNLELARLPETVSSPTIGQFRIQFWRDTVQKIFAGNPPREPISILLHSAVSSLTSRVGKSGANSLKFWLLRLINTREKHMENKPFTDLAALEDYAENTYATLMYTTLGTIPLRSVHLDHLASHIGKACGIIATLRGIPVLAAPSRPVQGPAGASVGNTRNPALLLPLDVMAEAGLKEEDVFRRGPDAEFLQDAIFKSGAGPGHDYEHEGDTDHIYSPDDPESTSTDIRRGFGVLLEAIPAADYLQRLESSNFDPFKVRGTWKLPWRLWQGLRRQQI
ncbi:Squalene/phytoene synthase [Lasiosphaeria miniovina]|uniref:Squalene/phytoene synthase n=1 Tax=Lasiosphaeria miniovina TaxID=1954250 RepID=A0AA40DHY6_9PEZI|nr:Squalene/phytoene synthase [Lasiosphaeria miniovina]KAK0703850.1 Squalene/phytoene synthase [Lasiosphaeria miniovina]